MVEKVQTSVKKEADRQYFFSKLKNPLWVGPLRERGWFDNPPGKKHLPDGYVQYPHWPELSYLVTITEESPDQVVEIILSLPKTDNPRVYYNILEIAIKLGGHKSVELLPKLIEYIELDNPFLAYRYPELLQHWINQGNIDEALSIVKLLIAFRKDPREREKLSLRKENQEGLLTLLEPIPRFDQWEYEQILEKGVRPLVEHVPYQVACILIDTVANMIRLGIYREDLKKRRDEDYSEIWCRRLDKPKDNYQEVKATLVQTLTYACEQVYDKVPEAIDDLDKALRKNGWKVFRRLRQHLYASYPNNQTLPWIREQILAHDHYSKWEHHYEFQIMTRKACECLGFGLLNEEEQKRIFDAILSGPSKEVFREWMGKDYNDELFQKRQRYFHRMQLRPFAVLLSGKVRRYFGELEGDTQTRTITDDCYSPYGEMKSGIVSKRSPKSAEDLGHFTDEELMTYLNDWDEEHHDKDNWLIEINISALADAFQTLFKEKLIQDNERLAFWMSNRGRITRPIYVAAMLKAMLECVKEKNFDKLDQSIEFCAWVLSHSDSERVKGQPEPLEESRDYPDWGTSRRVVVDLIDACVSKDIDAPIIVKDGLKGLLQQVCSQFDWRLDRDDQELIHNMEDPITVAINNTRSRALASLVSFGFWVRRRLSEDNLLDVTEIFEKRLAEDAETPLTRPEHALLGMHFSDFYTLNQDWSAQHQEAFFPQENKVVWRDAFDSYIRFNRPEMLIFKIMRREFSYAINNLNVLTIDNDDGKEFIDRLGQHLFFYYIWGVYPLLGNESLLEQFYNKTNNNRKLWGQLFDYVGRTLKNHDKNLDKTLIERVIAFFNWRFTAAEPLEMQAFTFWLEAECLDAAWRLQSYSNILQLAIGKDLQLSRQVGALNKFLPNHLELVIECFAKITDVMNQGTQMYISDKEAKLILKAGLSAEDSQIRKNAERAREKLLQLGRFDFLDIEG